VRDFTRRVLLRSLDGFRELCSTTIGYEGGSSIISQTLIPLLLTLPVSTGCTYLILVEKYSWDRSMHLFLGPSLGFLLVIRMQIAYARYWEAREQLDSALKSCRNISILVVTQYHRHYGQPGTEVPKCVDDVRRYIMLYFLTMSSQLVGDDLRQNALEEFITAQELLLLTPRPRDAAVTCTKWIAARLATLEALGYMAPLQLHETNDGLDGLVAAFARLVTIRETATPLPIRQLCSLLTVVYVYSAPLALATAFGSFLETFWSVLLRTMVATLLIALSFFGINQTAAVLERPLADEDQKLVPFDELGRDLHRELLGIFSEPIPPLVGQVEPELLPALDGGRGAEPTAEDLPLMPGRRAVRIKAPSGSDASTVGASSTLR